jgi:GH43 family beta-xylosidase
MSRSLLLALILLASTTPSLAEGPTPYSNPVLGDPRRPVADPFVLKWNGEYYLYATGDPVQAYRSTDLVHWKPLGGVLAASKDPKAWNQAELWAPEVVYREGKFYLYYTATRKSSDWKVSEAERRVGVAVAESPTGPFVDAGKPVTKTWAIDGTVFKDPDGGQEHLFYSYVDETKLRGAAIVVDRLTDFSAAAGKPALVTRGTEAWEDRDGDPSNGSVRYTNEAPVVVKRLGRYLLMYSGGAWDLSTYAVGFASSDKLPRGGLTGPGWRKPGPPFLRGTRLVEAPGHHSLVKAPNNVDDICVHHARVVPFADATDRLPFVARLYWHHDRPFMLPPTTSEQAPPDRPLFEDTFVRAAGPLGASAGWKIEGGTWAIADGQLRQNKADGTARVVARVAALQSYVFEANLRFALPGTAEGAIGVTAFEAGAENRVDVWIDAKKRALVSGGKLGGKVVPEQSTKLAGSFAPDAYHQLLITKNAGRLQVALDGVSLQARRLAMGAGGVALLTRDAKALFDGIAVTSAFEDDFRAGRETCTNLECLGWTTGDETWKLGAGQLQQTDAKAERAITTKGDLARDYEISATVRFGKSKEAGARVGVAAAATEKGDLVLASLDRAAWPQGRLHLEHIAAGKVVRDVRATLPRGFDPSVPHTLRVVKQGPGFTVFLDGKETAAARFPIAQARGGLYTAVSDASFLSVAGKRLIVPQNHVLNASFETEQWDDARARRDNPWLFEGTARPSDCCGRSGLRRLVVSGGAGRARQRVTGLPAGRYTLRAWVTTNGAVDAELAAQVPGASPVRLRSRTTGWAPINLQLQVPDNGVVDINFLGVMDRGAAAWVAADDVYLFRQ